MKKRILAVFLMLAVLCALTACGTTSNGIAGLWEGNVDSSAAGVPSGGSMNVKLYLNGDGTFSMQTNAGIGNRSMVTEVSGTYVEMQTTVSLTAKQMWSETTDESGNKTSSTATPEQLSDVLEMTKGVGVLVFESSGVEVQLRKTA